MITLRILLIAAAGCAFGFDSANPQAFVGIWRVDLSKSTLESGPKPDSFEIEISLSEDRLVIQQTQAFGARKINRTYRLPGVHQEATVELPQGIQERWQTASRDANSIEADARVVQVETEIGWRRMVLRIAADGNELALESEIGFNGQHTRFKDRLLLTRVKKDGK